MTADDLTKAAGAEPAAVEPMHEDLKLAIGFRIHNECRAALADAFIQRHGQTGFTFDDVATRLGSSREYVVAFLSDPQTVDEEGGEDELGLSEIAVMAAAMGGRLRVVFEDLSQEQPPSLRDGDGI